MRRIALAGMAAGLGLALSGCFGEALLRVPDGGAGARDAASVKRTFRLTVNARLTRPGTSRLEPPGRTIRGSVYKGTFKTTSLGPVRPALRLVVGGGRWVARINGQEDHTRGVATDRGLALATFNDTRTGSACFRFTLTTRDHGLSHTGTFSVVGGTGSAARVAASGRVTNRPDAAPNPAGGGGTTTGSATYGTLSRARGLTDACRALRRL